MLDLDAIRKRRAAMGTLEVMGERDAGTEYTHIIWASMQHDLGELPELQVSYPDERTMHYLLALSKAPADIDTLINELERYRQEIYNALIVAAQAYQVGMPQLDAPRLHENHSRIYRMLRKLYYA